MVERHRLWFTGLSTRFDYTPVILNSLFLGLGLFSLVVSGHERMQAWRASLTLLIGCAALTLSIRFINDIHARMAQSQNDFSLFQSGIGPFHPRIWISTGPYVAAGLSAMLMVIGTLDLRGWLAERRNVA